MSSCIPATSSGRYGARRSFFVWAAAAIAAIVFIGFARTYYLKAVFDTPVLTWLVHLHGFLLTLWFGLFFLQSYLIASHQEGLHRRLGIFGSILATLIVIVGVTTLLHLVKAPQSDPDGHIFLLELLGADLFIFLLFAGFVGAAILMRRKGDVHKRLMLLGSLTLLWPPMSRIPIDFISQNFLVSLVLTDLCVIACVVIDSVRNRRIHPVLGWGAVLNIASLHLVNLGVGTDTWLRIAARLVS
jgi:hypothetical protein